MDKRGLTDHIDWIIGIGIFLVLLGFILTFFKPGVKDVFEPDTLLDILEENYLNDKEFTKGAMWQITKQPVFLKQVQVWDQGSGTGTYLIEEQQPKYVVLKGKFVDGNPSGEFPLVSRSNQNIEVFFSVSGANENQFYRDNENEAKINERKNRARGNANPQGLKLKVKEELRSYNVPSSYNEGPIFCVNLNDQKKAKFLVISSSEIINDGPFLAEDGSDCPQADEEVLQACGNIADQDESNDECALSYELGGSETLTGLNLDKNLGTYNEIKTLWGFPDSKDFKIVVYNPEGGNDLDKTLTIGDPEPPLEANVYTRTFNVQVLNHDAKLVPATVSLQVW